MKTEQVTEQILGAWDEIANPEDEPEQPQEPETEAPEVEQPAEEEIELPGSAEEEAEPEPDEDEDPAEEEPGDEDEDGKEEEPGEEGDQDPEVKAFLSKYQGDVDRALKGGYQMQQAVSRLGQDKQALARRIQELEGQLAEANAFTPSLGILSDEQRTWIGEAVESGNPLLYVREAAKAGEFDLARAVCNVWGEAQPYEALRAAQMVDYAEASTASTQQYEPTPEVPIDRGLLLQTLQENGFADLPVYSQQIAATMEQLGENHPLVLEARSDDPAQAARGIITLYEIARSSAQSVATQKDEIRNGHREAASSARKKAVVSSAAASPSPGESPRAMKLGPGLTLEQLDSEWERNS